jgi:hypothetical protein
MGDAAMTAGVLRSFEPGEGIANVLLVDSMSETTLCVRGSDRVTIASLACGEPIQFEIVRDGQGRVCAIGVSVIKPGLTWYGEDGCGVAMSGHLSGLDASTRRLVRVFAVKLTITGSFAVMLCTVNGYPLLRSLALLCGWQGLFAASIALVQRQNLQSSALTGWDESAAFLGIAALVRLVGTASGWGEPNL